MGSSNAETLADYVRRIRQEKGLSTPAVERNSKGAITDGYVSHIENGYVKNVSPEKLRALAKGLDVNEDEIFAVARGKSPHGREVKDAEVEAMLYEYKLLPDEDQRELESLKEHFKSEIKRRGFKAKKGKK